MIGVQIVDRCQRLVDDGFSRIRRLIPEVRTRSAVESAADDTLKIPPIYARCNPEC